MTHCKKDASLQKPDLRDLAERYARKARSDEIALEKLAVDDEVPDDVIGFHAQQAAEKLLKAALAGSGVTPPRIHDIRRLARLLEDAGLSPPQAVSDARRLTPWAVEFRYDMLDEQLDRQAACEAVNEIRAWVADLLAETKS
jgi:HEPN domain-containing protein